MADGLPMMALGMTALHLRIVDFKFTHNFIIGDRLLDTEIIFVLEVILLWYIYVYILILYTRSH